MKRSLSFGLIALCTSLYTGAAVAQVRVPGTASPDLRQRQLQIQPTQTMPSGKALITVNDGQTKKIKGDGISFVLKSVTIEGATAFKPEELEPLYKDMIGTKITLDQLNKLADDVTAHYRNKGYILTRAVLPPQQISGGQVKIRIVEGYINEVKVQGDRADDKLIRAYADKIRASKPLDVAELERYLLLMEDLPGVEARAVLQPSASAVGASDVIVTITRKKVEAAATLDNRGSRYIGPEQLGLTAMFNDVIGLNEQTQFRAVTTPLGLDELFYGEVRHEEQLGTEGTKLAVSASYIKTRPQYTLEPFDVVGTSTMLAGGVTHPLLRSRRTNWFVNSDFTLRNVELKSLGSDLSYDKTRVLGIGTSYDFVDSFSAINRLEMRYAHGFDLGTKVTDKLRSRANGEPVFEKVTGRASRIQPISGPWSVLGKVSGQYSPDPLVASEEFALGGAEFGTAYDAAELTGDSGAAARLELQYNEAPGLNYLAQYQLYGFYDIGSVWNHNPIAGSEAARVSLSSAGLGARFNVNDQISGGIEGAYPLTKKVSAFGADGADPRVFFNLQYRY